jgi:hypothetical protein
VTPTRAAHQATLFFPLSRLSIVNIRDSAVRQLAAGVFPTQVSFLVTSIPWRVPAILSSGSDRPFGSWHFAVVVWSAEFSMAHSGFSEVEELGICFFAPRSLSCVGTVTHFLSSSHASSCLPLTHPPVFFSLILASFPTHLLVLSFVHWYFLPPSFCIFLCPVLLSCFLDYLTLLFFLSHVCRSIVSELNL